MTWRSLLISIGLAFGLWGCGQEAESTKPVAATNTIETNTIELKFNPLLGKVVLNPRPGDVIGWNRDVRFPPHGRLNPCKGDPNPTRKCIVDASSGRFVYRCANCEDPEVEVGTETQPPIELAALQNTSRVAIYIGCSDNNQVILDLETENAYPHQRIVWQAMGDNAPHDWQVKAKGCSETDFNETNPACTIKAKSGTMITYTTSSTMCGDNTNSNGKINVR